ncbi:hypoxanthine-guanine phosphoribosyltransferase [Leishmania major strain Friedlin]|uniref:Hypoxanthine phosphoribosyltransferase n=2 Tax=Leishmania major TaxID=5664 RepID=Q4QCC3_LEIMA|nr:hypoxanthine-guanine phosphoribosyltransferase [Leishmania major strain Friedlin]CAG9573413.1 hypoxanthine-guanine_phosphoribosyltransferase [Leishmania major strain Friedlin]CAJ04328.1 hypoxanthine-guanine phosphoribosyltransferase [Leishmania major strain Friedlin]|eukprot:XP_001683025.1 hypoxanthine-guanine phosphoribosyltransferase [Leishmania major strain Friedlin]
MSNSAKSPSGIVGDEGRRNYPMSAHTLVTQEQVWAATAKCAKKIAEDYRSFKLTTGNPLYLLCVLKGSFIFTADLARFLADEGVPVKVEFICASSYGTGVETSGQVRMLLDVRDSVENRHILIVEDIVDSAITLQYLMRFMLAKKPASLKTVVLLDKPSGRKVEVLVDYPVITIPHAFVIGYGMDYAESYRELRDICVLKKEYYEKPESKV